MTHRPTTRAILISTSALLALAVPDKALAQFDIGRMPQNPLEVLELRARIGQEIESFLLQAEAERLAGRCAGRDARLKNAEDRMTFLERGRDVDDVRERIAVARARAEAIRKAPCPPRAGETEPPPAVLVTPPGAPPTPVDGPAPATAPAPSTREPGQTRTLEDLQVEYAASACGSEAEKEAARKNLLTALDRAIAIERSPQKRDRLLTQRQRVADGTVGQPKPCPKPAEAPATSVGQAGPPVSIDELGERAALRFSIAEAVETRFNLAESARLEGNCTYWANVLGSIETLIGKPGDPHSDDEVTRAAFEQWRARLAAERAKPCPPPAATPPREVGMLPRTGSPLDAADAVARERFARRAAIFVNALYLSSLLPGVGIGVRRDGPPGAAPERFAAETPRRVNGFGISAGFQTKLSPYYDLRATVRYDNAEGSSDYTIPATGTGPRVDTGVVFGRLSNGSSGIIAGFGGMGTTRIRATGFALDGSLGTYITKAGSEASGIRIEVGLGYERAERRHDLSIASSGTSGGSTFSFGQTRAQSVEEDYLDIFGGLELDFPITGTTDGGLTFGGRLRAGPYRRDSGMRSTERNTANFGPNRDVTLDVAEKKGSWGGRIRASAGLEYRFDNGMALTAGGGIDYRSEVGAIVNPNSGDQVFFQGQTTRLETSDKFGWNASVGLRFPF